MKEGRDLAGLTGYLLQRTNLLFFSKAAKSLAPFGISPARFSALMLVRDNPGCTQTALGEALDVNRSSAMKIINNLEERGLVSRQPGKDARANALHLTEKGEKLIPQIMRELKEGEDRLFESLDAEDRATLNRLLDRLRRPRS